eukprot:CAMPEP_0182947430 /NCGR_PEP_ID=MMETSP0105_2-20130417/58566_1 /TAXON_ID=81532 ORGANISM="Acanthoeca-like sp., Strain 10tr" /NCGR_SAMPLE_ID=MMETSP0105_2 /ASSEMBLY_ACC=CAM_ASM_000205 /LENGTH=116 /DNA_ID=CAMNT_0025087657 /DNA_START=21 /DNA_END=367 /DNA_ORIENTATION=-
MSFAVGAGGGGGPGPTPGELTGTVTEGEAHFLGTAAGGGLAVVCVMIVVASEDAKRGVPAATQYAQIMLWNVVLLMLTDSRMIASRIARTVLSGVLVFCAVRCLNPWVRVVCTAVS